MRLGLPIFRLFATPSWRKMVRLEDEFYAEVDRLMDDALDKLKISDSEKYAHLNLKNHKQFLNLQSKPSIRQLPDQSERAKPTRCQSDSVVNVFRWIEYGRQLKC